MVRSGIQSMITGSRYPFIASSTLRMSGGGYFPTEVVKHCLLYPVTDDPEEYYAHISKIHRDGNTGLIEIRSNAQRVVCVIDFDLTVCGDTYTSELTGYATDSKGFPCGSMTVTSALVPLFFKQHLFDSTSLVLLPSCCRFVCLPRSDIYNNLSTATPRLLYNGEEVTGLSGDGVTTNSVNGGVAVGSTEAPTPAGVPSLDTIKINGVEFSDVAHLLISTGPGGLRVKAAGDTITIGRLADL